MRPIDRLASFSHTRRQLLGYLLLLAGWLPARILLSATPDSTGTDVRTVAAFLDVLLPADESPSASQLGVDVVILAEARKDASFGQLLALGCQWLDQKASENGEDGFHMLPEDRQLQIVSLAEHNRTGTLPKVFFENLRYRAFGHYYADPRSWTALRYKGPPQPRGFLNHDIALSSGGRR